MGNGGNNNYNYNNGNGNNWYGQYFVGPYCNEKDGFSINLGVFYDETCTTRASDNSAYSDRNYGVELPYSNDPIVESDCISCMQVDENNNNNQNYNNNNYYYQQEMEVAEICEQVYEQSAKCEGSLENVMYKDTSGCDFINNLLPRLEGATRSISRAGQSSVAKPFAITFGILTVLCGSYSVCLYRKLSRGRVSLNSEVA